MDRAKAHEDGTLSSSDGSELVTYILAYRSPRRFDRRDAKFTGALLLTDP